MTLGTKMSKNKVFYRLTGKRIQQRLKYAAQQQQNIENTVFVSSWSVMLYGHRAAPPKTPHCSHGTPIFVINIVNLSAVVNRNCGGPFHQS